MQLRRTGILIALALLSGVAPAAASAIAAPSDTFSIKALSSPALQSFT